MAGVTPTRVHVASYVPSRTLAVDDTTGTPLATFGTTTRPSGDQVDALIVDAVAWVLAPVTELPATAANLTALEDLARSCAALRAAGLVELSWPERDGDVNTGQALLTQASAMRTDLIAAVTAADDGDVPGVVEVLPLWSFPEKPAWSDLNL